MQIKIINKIENLLLIKEEWDELFIKGDYSTFQSFDFNYYSWKHELFSDNRNQLAITVITIDESVVAIFPFYIDSNRRLRFINDIHFDFCDFISEESINFSEVYNYLKQEVDFKSIRLINVMKESNIYKEVKDLNTINIVVKSISEYSVLNLDKGTFPHNVPHYRSHQKYRINRNLREYKEKQSIIARHQQRSFPKKEILLLKETMINLGLRKDNFLTNDRLLLIECLYNSGIIILHIIRETNKINSISILLEKSPREYMFWIDLFDDSKAINIFNYSSFIKKASLEKSLIMNFGRGRYFYKVSNFSPEFHELHQIHIFSNNWKKLMFLIINQISSLLILIYKRIKE